MKHPTTHRSLRTPLRGLLAVALAAAALTAAAQTRVVAHRGHWKTAGSAQNSLASLAKADSLGVYASEFDVWMTADGALVVNHDDVFRGVDLEKATAEEATAVVLDNGENLPTLDAYLKLAASLPATRLVLELKSLSDLRREDEAAAKIVDMLHRYGLERRTDVIAFSINACLAFRKADPGLPVWYLDGDLPPSKLAALGLAGLDYCLDVVESHPEWIEEAHALGLGVNVWTVDDPEAQRRLVDAGVDLITTNRPDNLLRILAE